MSPQIYCNRHDFDKQFVFDCKECRKINITSRIMVKNGELVQEPDDFTRFRHLVVCTLVLIGYPKLALKLENKEVTIISVCDSLENNLFVPLKYKKIVEYIRELTIEFKL